MLSHLEGNWDFHRENKTVDIVKRLGVIAPRNIHLKGHPIDTPSSFFNPSFLIEDEKIILYGRVILGYFTYTSAIAEVVIPHHDLKTISKHSYSAKIKIYPDNKYDLWGTEDPRVYVVNGEKLLTYCGRTINYFNKSIEIEKTTPLTAVYHNSIWRKNCVFKPSLELKEIVISDKDAFIVKTRKGLKLFHRIHIKNSGFHLVVSDIKEDIWRNDKLREIEVENTRIIFEPKDFEDKIGWSTPPVEIDGIYIFFLHAVERELKRYKIFAVMIDEELELKAATPVYIMEPREIYEIHGDRPYTIFPCGAQLFDDKIILSYGAGDSLVAFGEVDLNELLSLSIPI